MPQGEFEKVSVPGRSRDHVLLGEEPMPTGMGLDEGADLAAQRGRDGRGNSEHGISLAGLSAGVCSVLYGPPDHLDIALGHDAGGERVFTVVVLDLAGVAESGLGEVGVEKLLHGVSPWLMERL